MNAQTKDREGFAAFMLRMRQIGFGNSELIAAMEAIPRRGFVPSSFADAAWSHRTVPIDCGEVIEGADIQAKLIDALHLEPHHRVLEIGTGSGYTAAVMARLTDRVLTFDRFQMLVDQANKRFTELNIGNAIAKKVDGLALPIGQGPFDRMIVWSAFPTVPKHLADFVTANGEIICPVIIEGQTDQNRQKIMRLTKIGSRFEREELMEVRFSPLRSGLSHIL